MATKRHTLVAALICLPALSACFMTDTPLITKGTLLSAGPVTFCSPDDPCETGTPSGDGYRLAERAGREPGVQIRFEPLTEAGGVPVYLGEMDLSEKDDPAFYYVVAQSAGTTDGAPVRYNLVMLDCADLAAADLGSYGVERADQYSCTVKDFARFRASLIETYSDEFADAGWWTDPN